MELLHEIFTFLWAVATGWAGYATGGIIVAVVALWHTFRDKPIGRKVGIALAVVFLCMAVFKAWQEQYQKANVVAAQGQGSPKLSSEIMTVYTAHTVEGDTLDIILVSRIKNAGAPSVVSRMWVTLEVHGEKYETVVVLPPERLVIPCTDCPNQVRTFYKEDLLTLKVAVIPIPEGGIVSGFIPVEIHGITEKAFADPTTVLHLKLEDVRGNISVEDEPMARMLHGKKGFAESFPFGMKQ